MTEEKELMVNKDWCKGCHICVKFCPKEVLNIYNEKVVIENGDNCIFCGICELRCPDNAIYIRGKINDNCERI